jgi:hypothetical protein
VRNTVLHRLLVPELLGSDDSHQQPIEMRITNSKLGGSSQLVNKWIWVCLKIGYIPNYSHLIGIMIINHWVYGYTILRHTHMKIKHDVRWINDIPG